MTMATSRPMLDKLTARMGHLLGPDPVAEIVITLYDSETDNPEEKKINFQIEGMNGQVPPPLAYRMLEVVAQQVAVQIAQMSAPVSPPVLPPKEAPTS